MMSLVVKTGIGLLGLLCLVIGTTATSEYKGYGDYEYGDYEYEESSGDNILDPRDICDGDQDACAEIESIFEEAANQIVTSNFSINTSLLIRISNEENTFVERCRNILDGQNLTATVQKEGVYWWLSHMHREEFYQNCLMNFDIFRLHRKATDVVKKMSQFSRDISDSLHHKGGVQIGAGVSQVIGGVLGGIGLVLSPFTAGASLVLNVVGSGVATSGALASFIQPYLTEKWTSELITQSAEIAEQTEKDMEFIHKLLGLFVQSQQKRANFLWGNDYKRIQDSFSRLLMEKTRGQIMVIPNLAKFSASAHAAYVQYARDYPASLPSRLSKKISQVYTHIIKNKFTSFKAITSFKKLKKIPISAAVKRRISGVVRNVGSGALSLINLGFGVWDILKGTDSINGKGDLADIFRTAAKKYSYDADSTLTSYKKIVGEPNIKGYKNSYQEVSRIAFKGNNGQIYAGTFLRVESWNPNNPLEGGSCETNVLDMDSYHKLSSGYWYFVDNNELKDCRNFKIYNNHATVQIYNQYNDAVAISYVTISTETRIVPVMACSWNGKLDSLDYSVISAHSGNLSTPIICFPLQGISMIKMHTCDKRLSGTDGRVMLTITQVNIDDQGNEEYIKDGFCTTPWLDNKGDDRETGQVDTYHIDALGKCTEPFRDTFSPTHGYLKSNIAFEYIWLFDGWCMDGLKIYSPTSINPKSSKAKAFRCDVHGAEGLGTNFAYTDKKEKTCKLEEPNARGINKIKLHVTNSNYASSSGVIRLRICNDDDVNHTGGKKECCYTNQVYGQFTRNDYFNMVEDDLGMCEGFIVKGSQVNVRINKQDGNSVSFDSIAFFGASAIQLTTSEIQFIQCSGKQIWAETNKIYWRDSDGQETSWINWDTPDATWSCKYKDFTTIKNVHVRLCSDNTAGTASVIETEFTNIKGGNCSTQSLNFSNNTYQGDFHTFIEMGSCSSLKVIDNRVEMNLKNMAQNDNLCLTHVWVDVSNSGGDVRQLQCKFHAKRSNLNVINKEGARIPMMCQ